MAFEDVLKAQVIKKQPRENDFNMVGGNDVDGFVWRKKCPKKDVYSMTKAEMLYYGICCMMDRIDHPGIGYSNGEASDAMSAAEDRTGISIKEFDPDADYMLLIKTAEEIAKRVHEIAIKWGDDDTLSEAGDAIHLIRSMKWPYEGFEEKKDFYEMTFENVFWEREE